MSYVEESIQCPYDINHIILKSRFITHLCKCRKQYGGNSFSICPFNASHSVLTPELQYHINNCVDRIKLDSYLYVVGDKCENEVPKPDVEIPTLENWDDESQTKMSYLDVKDKLISKRPLLRLPAGKSKSQRKEFFANETERFEILNRGEIPDVSSGSSFTSDVELNSRFSNSSGISLGRGVRNPNVDDKTYAIIQKNIGRGRPAVSLSSLG